MIYGNYLREKYNNTAVKLADAEGVPCVMEYSKGKNLRNYEICGNSVQDGTPTPDTPVEIQSVGDLTTKNLLYSNATTRTINGVTMTYDNGGITLNGTCTTSANFDLNNIVLSAGTYTLSANVNKVPVNNGYAFVQLYDSTNNQTITLINSNAMSSITTTISDGTFLYRIRIDKGTTYDNIILQPQLELGSTATEYEPYHKYDIPITVAGTSSETKHIYLNEPLRKVGDYADYIDFKNKKVVRNVGETTFNGSETWVKTGDTLDGVYQGFAVSNSVYNIPKGTKLICLSDKFPYASGKAANIVTIANSAYGLRIIIGAEYVPDLDVTTFKTWLSANNVKIIYPIATPTEESISLPTLKTFKGTSIMSVNTTVQPSNIKTKYVRL